MRVIAGSARGTKLCCPEGLAVRPTHDRVKEAVFSMLQEQVIEASVLDLFAGTGALGIEALSRGAHHAVFVDSSHRSLKATSDNLTKTHLMERATLVQSDFLAFLNSTEDQFDLIFLDPPYAEGYLQKILELVAKRQLLTENGIVYCEFDGDMPVLPENLYETVRNKKYGRAHVLLLKRLL